MGKKGGGGVSDQDVFAVFAGFLIGLIKAERTLVELTGSVVEPDKRQR